MNALTRPGSALDPFSDVRRRARLWRTFGAFLMGVEVVCVAVMAFLSASLQLLK